MTPLFGTRTTRILHPVDVQRALWMFREIYAAPIHPDVYIIVTSSVPGVRTKPTDHLVIRYNYNRRVDVSIFRLPLRVLDERRQPFLANVGLAAFLHAPSSKWKLHPPWRWLGSRQAVLLPDVGTCRLEVAGLNREKLFSAEKKSGGVPDNMPLFLTPSPLSE